MARYPRIIKVVVISVPFQGRGILQKILWISLDVLRILISKQILSRSNWRTVRKDVSALTLPNVFTKPSSSTEQTKSLSNELSSPKRQTAHVINLLQSDSLRNMFGRQTKNDTLDAFFVADVIRFGCYCETQVAPENIVALRELCRQRFFIVDTASNFKRSSTPFNFPSIRRERDHRAHA